MAKSHGKNPMAKSGEKQKKRGTPGCFWKDTGFFNGLK